MYKREARDFVDLHTEYIRWCQLLPAECYFDYMPQEESESER